jgi:ADP-ribose pyrophosphatase YjhB (NUDIX family)
LEFPGGRLDSDESAWAGALREWQEETGNELPEGEIVATWDNDHGPYRLFVYVIATENEIHLNPDKDDMEVVDPDHPHASQPEVAAWYYPKDLATAKKMVRKELRKFDWSVLTDAVDGKERPKMMYLDLLKGFGDPGSTQDREANGQFGTGQGDQVSSLVDSRSINTANVEGDHYTLYHGTTDAHAAGIQQSGLQRPEGTGPGWLMLTTSREEAATYATSNGSHEGSVVEFHVPLDQVEAALTNGETATGYGTEDQTTNHGLLSGSIPASWVASVTSTATAKGFGDPGSTQEREANGEFGPGTGASVSTAASVGATFDALLTENNALTQEATVHALSQANSGMPSGKDLYTSAQGGGFSHNADGSVPTTGFQVGGQTEPLTLSDNMDPQEAGAQIEAYQQANADILSQDRMAIGGWNDGKGSVVVEPSVNVSDRTEATDLGEANNQESVHDNVTGEDIPTGGTGVYTGMSVDPVMARLMAQSSTMSMALDLLIKGFGDPNSTQDREPNGQFGEGSGASAESERSASDSKLEEVAIDNFGAAVEMQGQQFVTPNGTILDLPQGDGHDSIVQVTGGNPNTATSRAIDAGFARTSLDMTNGGEGLGLVMEFSRPMTDPQISAVMQAAKDNDLMYFAIDVPPVTAGGFDRGPTAAADGALRYSGEKESPTLSGIAGMIRDANVAAGGVRKSIASIMLFKTVASNSETNDQGRDEHGQFEVGSGGSHEMAGTTKDPYLKDYPNFGRSYTVTPTDKQIAAAKAFLAAHGKGSCTTYEGGKAALQATLAQGTAGNGNPNWYSAVRSELNESIDHGAPTNIQAALVSATTSKCAWAITPSASGTSPYAGTTYYPNLTAAATCISVVSENSSFVITQEEADKINAATASGPATFGGEPISDDNVRNADGNMISGDPVLATIDGNGDPIIGPDGERVIQYANDLTDQQVGKFISMSGNSIVPGVGIGMTGGLVNGIMIARGADPSVVLNGDSTMKQNSFANNITYPDQNTTTTQDSHQTNIFMGGGTEKADLQAQGTFRSMPGGYYLMNQATMELAQENGLPTGNAAQAVMWSTQTADEAQAKIMKAAKPNFPDYRPCSSDDEGGEAETDTVSHPYVVVIRSKRGKMMKPRLASSL